jgi:hypothetical protein
MFMNFDALIVTLVTVVAVNLSTLEVGVVVSVAFVREARLRASLSAPLKARSGSKAGA